MAALTEKCQEIFVAVILAFDASEAVVRVATIQIPVNDRLQIRLPETVLPGEMIVIDLDKSFKNSSTQR